MPTFSGKVVNEFTGNPVQGAQVTVAGRSVTTSGSGEFSVDVPEGEHRLQVDAPRFSPVEEGLRAFTNKRRTITLTPEFQALNR